MKKRINKGGKKKKYINIKLKLKYGKYLEYYLNIIFALNIFSLLNFANITLLSSTISDSYAKMGN